MKTLKQAKIGETVKVVKLHGEGVDVFVRLVAPLGYPIVITVRGYELSLLKAVAEMIEVE